MSRKQIEELRRHVSSLVYDKELTPETLEGLERLRVAALLKGSLRAVLQKTPGSKGWLLTGF